MFTVDLCADLVTVARQFCDSSLVAAVRKAFDVSGLDGAAVRRYMVLVVLDPVQFCRSAGAARALESVVYRLCAAYVLSVAPAVTSGSLASESLQALSLPSAFRVSACVARWGPVAVSADSSDSDDEIWLGASPCDVRGVVPSPPGSVPTVGVPRVFSCVADDFDLVSDDEVCLTDACSRCVCARVSADTYLGAPAPSVLLSRSGSPGELL